MIGPAVLRAHQLRKIGPGEMWLVERRWLQDGRVLQRINRGVADLEDEWKQIGRWSDLDAERAAIARDRWELG